MTASLLCTSAGVPRAMVRPLSSTWMRSQTPMMTRMLCSISSTPQPKRSGISRTRCMTSSHSRSDIPAAGSSSRTKAGFIASARAMPTRRSSV